MYTYRNIRLGEVRGKIVRGNRYNSLESALSQAMNVLSDEQGTVAVSFKIRLQHISDVETERTPSNELPCLDA
jgi:hypothetical protein